MSVRVQIVEAFAKAEQSAPARWQRITGNLGNAGLTPKGKPGGGIGSAHFFAPDLTSSVLAFAAELPSEAVDVVLRLEGTEVQYIPRYTKQDHLLSPNGEYPLDPQWAETLRSYLERTIERWAAPTTEMITALSTDKPMSSIWFLELFPSIPAARLTIHDGDERRDYHFRGGKTGPRPREAPVRRNTGLSLYVLGIAGDLLRDSLERRPQSPTLPSEPQSGTVSDPTDESAALPGAAPTRDQDHNSIPGALNIPKGKREKRKTQASSSCGSGRPVHRTRETARVRNPREPAFHFGM